MSKHKSSTDEFIAFILAVFTVAGYAAMIWTVWLFIDILMQWSSTGVDR